MVSLCTDYTDSYIKWLEEIPSHWDVVRLRYLASEPLAYGANEAAFDDNPNFPRFIRITDINEDGSLRPETFKSLSPDLAEPYLLRKADVLLARSGATVGKAFIYRKEWGEACFAGYLIRFRCNKERLLPDFFYAITQSNLYWSQIREGTIQATIQNFSAEKYGDLLIPLPPLSEQKLIAQYLDRQTAKIDTLINAKQRLLELLAEKRHALINHAVTRGLNPDVPMCDLEIEWLGEIPEHWSVEQLKYHLSGIEQGWSPQSDTFPANEDEWGVLKVGAVNGWEFNPDENKRVPTELEIPLEYEIKPGDVLVSRANTPELVGSAALVELVRPRLLLCDKLYRTKIQSHRLLPEYLVYYLRSVAGRFVFERDARGASGSMQNISQEILANLWIPVPPVEEQYEIVTHIKGRHTHLGNLEVAARKTVELLHERRIALISAAITGHIRIPA